MVCPENSFTGQRRNNEPWSNWSGRVNRQLESIFIPSLAPPAGLPQLVRVALDASAAGKSLHAIGSGWSFDDAAIGDQWTVDILALRARLMGTVGEGLVPSSAPGLVANGPGLTDEWRQRQADRNGTRKLVHVEAGIKLWQLISMLDAAGLALPTLGGANGQALAGVINTSVHGGDWNQPAFPGMVRALHLVSEGGREVWIEPASASVTTDARLSPTLTCASVEIIRSDEVFNAALVGVGRFGVVYSYVLEVRPQFWVVEITTQPDRSAVFAALRRGARIPGRPFNALLALLAQDPGPQGILESRSGVPPTFFQLVLSTRNPPGIWVQRRWETNNQSDFNLTAAQNAPGELLALGLNAVFLAGFTSAQNPVIDTMVNGVVDTVMRPSATQGQRGRHAWITAGIPNGQFGSYRGVSVEVMFDANDPAYVTFLESVMNAGSNYRQAGWLTLRPSQVTSATLSMHNVGGTHAVSIEAALLGGLPDNEAFLTFIQQQALAVGGRLHWGQANNLLMAQHVAAQYGAQLASWQRALWRVSGNSTVFSTAFTRQRGLEPLPARRGISAAVPVADQLLVVCSGPLQTREWKPAGAWADWQNRELGVPQDAGPIGTVSEGGRTHLYFVASDGAVVFRSRRPNGSWSAVWWFVTTTNLERPWLGVPGGAVQGVSSEPGSVHVLYANASGNIIVVLGDTTTGAWVKREWVLNGRTAPGGSVTGVSRRPGQIDIFTVGTDRKVYTAAWNSQQGWAGWWVIPGISAPPGAPIAAVSRRPDFLDIFAADDQGQTMSAAWEPGAGWRGWWHIQNGFTMPGGEVTAVSRAQDLLDIFTVGTDSRVYSAAWDPQHGWGGWWSLNGAMASRPGAQIPAVSRSTNLLDIFFVDPSGGAQTMGWQPGGAWGGPWAI